MTSTSGPAGARATDDPIAPNGHRRPGPRFSLGIQTDKSFQEYGRIARTAEQLGFDGMSVFADLGFQPPLPALISAARATERIALGTACYNSTLLQPVEIAGQIAALDDASHGRAYLGLTRGAWLDQIGLSAPSSMAGMAEAITVIEKLLAGDDTGFAGRYFRIAPGFRLRYRLPRRRPPLLLGVWGPRGATLAGRHADEVKLGGCANPAMVALMSSWLSTAATASGRPADAVGVVAGAVTVVDHDRDVARRLARTEVAMYLDVVATLDRTVTVDPDLLARLRVLLAEGDDDAAGALIPDDVLDLFCFSGTPADIVEHAAALIAAGATRIEFGTPHGVTGIGGIELLGTEVLPALRARLAETGVLG